MEFQNLRIIKFLWTIFVNPPFSYNGLIKKFIKDNHPQKYTSRFKDQSYIFWFHPDCQFFKVFKVFFTYIGPHCFAISLIKCLSKDNGI